MRTRGIGGSKSPAAARDLFAAAGGGAYDLHSNLSEKLIVWNLIWFPLVRAC